MTPAQKAAFFNNPLAANVAGVNPVVAAKCGSAVCGAYIPPALVSFFRPSGFNATLQYYAPPQLVGLAKQVLGYYHLGYGNQVIPFSDMVANYSSGTSDYSGFTANFKKQFSQNWEFLASYKNVSPHVLRHSTAMDLLHHGVDRSVIALWLVRL